MKHTPGPWTAEYDNRGNGGFGEWYNVGPARVYIVGESSEADARLIAAAPDLLEALEAAVDQLEGFDGIAAGGKRVLFSAADRRAVKQARAALKLARGE